MNNTRYKKNIIRFINSCIAAIVILLFTGIFNSCKKNIDDECPKCPRVTAVTPNAAHFNDTVLITGKNLSPNPNYNDVLQVKFNGNLIPGEYILENYEDSIRLIIPKGTSSGPVTVDINVADELVSAGSANFTYLYYATVSTYAGSGVSGNLDNTDPLLAQFDLPDLIALNPLNKSLYVMDQAGSGINIREIDSNRVVSTITTSLGIFFTAIACSNTGVLFAAGGNGSNCDLYTIPVSGSIIHYAGCGTGNCTYLDGHIDSACFLNINAIAFDENNNMFIVDRHFIRRLDAQTEMVTTLAGTMNPGYINGAALSASFYNPSSLTVESDGTIYIADRTNNAVRMLKTGVVSTIAGVGGLSNAGFSNGTATTSLMNGPISICSDFEGNIFVLETGKKCIRKVDLDKNTISVFAGTELDVAYVDGLPQEARFKGPAQMVFDKPNKILYLTDKNNNCIRKILFE